MKPKIKTNDATGFSRIAILGGAVFVAVAFVSNTTLAAPYKYSPENPYPPLDPATVARMKKPYLTGDATTREYDMRLPDGTMDIPRKFDPLWFVTATRSFASQLASSMDAGPAASK